MQNVRLKDALTRKGYDVNYSWGMGVHSHNMGGAMLPEMMRWCSYGETGNSLVRGHG